MKVILLTLLVALNAHAFDLKNQVEKYENRYGLRNPYSKLTDYDGNGYKDLYGTRNFRLVLNGVYYRGGANNTHNEEGTIKKNSNPLQKDALVNLCEEGFSEAVYLYTTNYNAVPHRVTCKTRDGRANTLKYDFIPAMGHAEHVQLETIFNHITGRVPGPIYDHCWNGWHASGYIAAITLMQFCGWTHAEADRYWVRNTDGNSTMNSGLRKKIRVFRPFSDMQISREQRDLLCPQP